MQSWTGDDSFLKKPSDLTPEVLYIHPRSDGDMLTNQSLTAILLVIAGALLVLYLLRRRKRKSLEK